MEIDTITTLEDTSDNVAEAIDNLDIHNPVDEDVYLHDELIEESEEISDESNEKKPKKKWYKRWYVITTVIIVVSVLIFNHFFTIVVINGSSMEPNFHDGNIMLARRQYDLWRFDVVTIASEKANKILVKRVIGLPHETIKYENNKLFVNGEYKPDIYGTGNTENFEITLGENEYFCMGDNREDSADSRTYGKFTSDEIFAKIGYLTYPKK